MPDNSPPFKNPSQLCVAAPNTTICSIPAELLSHILTLAQALAREQMSEEDPDDPFMDSLRCLTSPVPFQHRASHVCARFREVTLSTPALWTTIFVAVHGDTERVKDYLHRSSQALLEVYIEFDGKRNNSIAAMARFQESLAPVLLARPRWGRLSIKCSRDNVAGLWLVPLLCAPPAPALRHIFIQVLAIKLNETVDDAWANDITNATQPTILQGAETIREVYLQGLACHIYRPPMLWVTTLELVQTNSLSMSYPALQALLSSMNHLTHFSMHGNVLPDPTHARSLCRLECPALRSLRISGQDGSIFSTILANLVAPQLLVLIMRDLHEPDLDALWATTTTTSHESAAGSSLAPPGHAAHFPLVQALMISDVALSTYVYKNICQMFPAVRTHVCSYVTLEESSSLTTLLTRAHPTRGVPWPHLVSLGFAFDARDASAPIKQLLDGRAILSLPLGQLCFETQHVEELNWWIEELTLEMAADRSDSESESTQLRGCGFERLKWPQVAQGLLDL